MKIKLHFSDKLSSPFSEKPDKNYKDKGTREREGEEGGRVGNKGTRRGGDGEMGRWGEEETRGQGEK
ncbi:MAG: hypothetical protein AAF757_12680 [Cyanobacteria bacterium P01_D01_bin.116]